MSKTQKERILAMYYILVNSGARISDKLQQTVDRINNERAAAYVAGVKA